MLGHVPGTPRRADPPPRHHIPIGTSGLACAARAPETLPGLRARLVTLVGNDLSELLVFVLLHFRRAPTTIPFAPPMLCVRGRDPPSPHVLARDAVHVPCCVCEFPTKSVTRRV